MLIRTLFSTLALAGALTQTGAAAEPDKAQVAGGTQPAQLAEQPLTVQPVFFQDAPDWRYKYYNGMWWYWLPESRWVVYIDNQWVPYEQGMFADTYAATDSYGYYDGGNYDGGYYGGGYVYPYYSNNYFGYSSPNWFPYWYTTPFWFGNWWWNGRGWNDRDGGGRYRRDWDRNWNQNRNGFARGDFRGRNFNRNFRGGDGVGRRFAGRADNRGSFNRGGGGNLNRNFGGSVNRGGGGIINRGNAGRGGGRSMIGRGGGGGGRSMIGRGGRGGGARMGLGGRGGGGRGRR